MVYITNIKINYRVHVRLVQSGVLANFHDKEKILAHGLTDYLTTKVTPIVSSAGGRSIRLISIHLPKVALNSERVTCSLKNLTTVLLYGDADTVEILLTKRLEGYTILI